MKFDVKFSCGHEARIDLYGPMKERARKIEWYQECGICPTCYAAKIEAEKAEGCVQKKMSYGEYKGKWFWLKTAAGSYDRKEKSIAVYVPTAYDGLEEFLERMAASKRNDEGYNDNVRIVRDAMDNGEISKEQAKTLVLAAREMRWK